MVRSLAGPGSVSPPGGKKRRRAHHKDEPHGAQEGGGAEGEGRGGLAVVLDSFLRAGRLTPGP